MASVMPVSVPSPAQRGWSVFISGIKMRINNTADLPHGGVKINGRFLVLKLRNIRTGGFRQRKRIYIVQGDI